MNKQNIDTHTLLLQSILDQQGEMRDEMRDLSTKFNGLSVKYENLRGKSVKWSAVGASIPICIAWLPKFMRWLNENS